MSADELSAFEGDVVVLRFRDGHVVKARVVHVDTDDRQELIYDVIEVVTPGQPQWSDVKPGTTVSAKLDDVESFSTD